MKRAVFSLFNFTEHTSGSSLAISCCKCYYKTKSRLFGLVASALELRDSSRKTFMHFMWDLHYFLDVWETGCFPFLWKSFFQIIWIHFSQKSQALLSQVEPTIQVDDRGSLSLRGSCLQCTMALVMAWAQCPISNCKSHPGTSKHAFWEKADVVKIRIQISQRRPLNW